MHQNLVQYARKLRLSGLLSSLELRLQMYDLASGQLIRQRRDVLLVGPPGLGKSHLAQAIGYPIIKAGFQVFFPALVFLQGRKKAGGFLHPACGFWVLWR